MKTLNSLGNKSLAPIVILIKNKNILLGLRNYTPDKYKTVSIWTHPGGRCDIGETIEMTIRREVQEETGITKFNIIEFLGETKGLKEGDRVLLFVATTKQEPVLMEPEKFSEWKWISFKEYKNNSLGVQIQK